MSVTAPYNFVPLAEHVAFASGISPDLEGPPSQDIPQTGGSESGSLTVTLTAHTPFLVSKMTAPDEPKTFILDPVTLAPALPGSSWRGAIRNVLEIATFGQMRLVDDQRTSMRDLNAVTDYRDHFTKTRSRDNYESTVLAGWLQLHEDGVSLTPCDYARVDHRDTLNQLSVKGSDNFRTRIDDAIAVHKNKNRRIVWRAPGQTPRPTDTAIAEIVERIFLDGAGAKLDCKLWVEDTPQRHQHDGKYLTYRKATKLNPSPTVASERKGTFVFTGMPSKKKHMEFFFFDPKEAKPLDEQVFRLFLAVHEEQEKESPTWAWRKRDFYSGKPIPVFYLLDDSAIRQIGLSMMFKMAGENSVHDLIRNTNSAHLAPESDTEIDLATRIFGRIGSKGKSNISGEAAAFRTRVSFGWGSIAPNSWKDGPETKVHLQKPKVGYFPTYIRQRDFDDLSADHLIMLVDKGRYPNGRKKVDTYVPYRTYMGWEGKPEGREEIRGWKRYPVLSDRNDLPPAIGDDASRLVPIIAGAAGMPTFTATLRYHNLHPIELGALIWAITWGGDPALRHSMGMGRPLGWGQIEAKAELDAAQQDALAAFVTAMKAWATTNSVQGGWEKSVQMRQLMAMADPLKGDRNRELLEQMRLDPDKKDEDEEPLNGFLKGKKRGYVLSEYALDDVSPWWDGPDPNCIKPPNGKDRELISVAANKMKAVRDTYDRSRDESANRNAAIALAEQNARLFPKGSRVYVSDKTTGLPIPKLRFVLGEGTKGRTWRLVSRKDDPNDPKTDELNVSRLSDAPPE